MRYAEGRDAKCPGTPSKLIRSKKDDNTDQRVSPGPVYTKDKILL